MTEAIQIGARAIKENSTSVDEVQRCLEELDESIATQKEVDDALGIHFLSQIHIIHIYIPTHMAEALP